MNEVAEAVRADIRALIAPVPVYPLKRINPPDYHAQLFTDSETAGRPAITPECDGILYFNVWAKREEDVDSVYKVVNSFLHAYSVPAFGDTYAISYRRASANKIEEDDGMIHLAVLYSTRYYRN